MRKIIKLFFSIIILLGLLACIMPYFIGRYVEHLLPTYYTAMTRFATVKIAQEKTHWFSADLTLEVAPVICPGKVFVLQQHINFGPIILANFNKIPGPHFALALLNTTAINAPFTLSSQALIQMNRVLVGAEQMKNLNYQDSTRNLVIPSVALKFSYDLLHATAEAQLTAPAITAVLKEAKNNVEISTNLVNLTSSARLKITRGIWYGDENIAADSINIKDQNQQVVANKVTMTDSLIRRGATVDLHLKMIANSLISDAVFYQPLAFNFQLRNMDTATLEAFVKALYQFNLNYSAQYDDAAERQLDNLKQQFYLQLLQHGLIVEVDNAQLGTPHGLVGVDLIFNTPAKNYADVVTALNASTNNITLTIPKSMAQALLQKYFGDSQFAKDLPPGVQVDNTQAADLILQQFLNLKFLRPSADNQSYILEISMKNGRLYINNLPLQDTLNLLAPASSSKKPSNKGKLAISTQEMVDHYDS